MAEKTQAQLLKEQLFKKHKNGYFRLKDGDDEKITAFAGGYSRFLNESRTERLFVKNAIALAKKHGFAEYDRSQSYKAGDKVYVNNRGKALMLCVIGSEPISSGVRISAAHIDSPRIDLKANPLFESGELAYFKTHYYGGIKKYQWPAIPLALYGTVIKANGETLDIALGNDENDPRFVITDLLPHLSMEQYKRPAPQLIKGEELNILIGSRPFNDDEESEAVKLNIMRLINEKYGMTEQDFVSAELCLVPAFDVCDIGFDRSMIGGYGHDDRVCSYPALMAALDVKSPKNTCITVLTDKEEVGSDGNTGLQSAYLKNFIYDLSAKGNEDGYFVLSRSKCLSADVNAAFDPTFSDVFERQNSSVVNGGVVITKYTGSRGKSDTSDASAEYMGYIRNMLDKNGVVWQTGELGKVDAGGGGTVAKYIANLDVDTVDLGVPVLSMHAPFEVISKLDLYMAYSAFLAFFED
mgnify:FL=1